MIDRIKNWFADDEDESGDRELIKTIQLVEVTWTETIEIEETDVTVTLGWSGGLKKTITYTESASASFGTPDYYKKHDDGSSERVIDISEQPSYCEEKKRETWTYEKEKRHTAWVTNVPPDVETTGRTKVVPDEEL